MSLRDEILEILGSWTITGTEERRDRIMRAVDDEISRIATTHVEGARQYADLLVAQRTGTDQGITRLALLAFVSGSDGPWNGERRVVGMPRTAWTRYRAHQIDREQSPDGLVVRITYRDHADAEQVATFENGRGTPTEVALLMVEDIDDLLDIVIDAHGVPGDEIPAAEIAEPITRDVASRVLNGYAEWLDKQPISTRVFGGFEEFLAAIDAGTVEP